MAAKKPAKPAKPAKQPAKRFTSEERSAMKDRARELAGDEGGEAGVLAKLAEMPPADRAIGERLHAILKAHAPTLSPKLWYGMPAYATPDGKTVCHFQPAAKFKTRYATLGFSDKARLDDGAMWPTVFAIASLSPAEEARIVALVKKALG